MAYFPSSGQFGGGFSNPNFGGPSQAALYQSGISYGPGTPGGWWNDPSAMAQQQQTYDRQRQEQMMGIFNRLSGGGGAGGGAVDPTAVINGAQPDIQRQMAGNFNAAASRMGSLGMMGLSGKSMTGGTPYADMLGQAAKEASDSTAEITNKYLYDAAKTNQDNQYRWAQLAGDWAQNGMFGGSGGGRGGAYGGGYQGQMAPWNDVNSPWLGNPQQYLDYNGSRRANISNGVNPNPRVDYGAISANNEASKNAWVQRVYGGNPYAR